MKKIGIVSIYDLSNFGNRLQNYAVQEFFIDKGYHTETLKNYNFSNNPVSSSKKRKGLKRIITYPIRKITREINHIQNIPRKNLFLKFENDYINTSSYTINYDNSLDINPKFDYFVIGSDQVWNPNFGGISNIFLLSFCPPTKRICFSPSLGTSDLSDLHNLQAAKAELMQYNYLCTREKSGSELLNKLLNTDKVITTLDPTLLISSTRWAKISQTSKIHLSKNYILTYFLKQNDSKIGKEIKNYAKKNNLLIINLLDKKSKFYNSGPVEFLYLIEHSTIFLTDSFHGVIFSIIFKKNFQVFRRGKEDKMYSRIRDLLELLKIPSNVEYSNIINWNINMDYLKINKNLEAEKIVTSNYILKQIK